MKEPGRLRASLGSIKKVIKRQVVVSTYFSSKAVHPLPPPVRKEEDLLGTAVPVAMWSSLRTRGLHFTHYLMP